MKAQTETSIKSNTVRDSLLQSNRPPTDFAKSMGHELHTPLNVIIGLCQLLKRDCAAPLSPMQRDVVQRIDRNARALLEASDHLLACIRTGNYTV